MCVGNTTESMEKKQEPTSKELLQLERESNPLQTRLRVVQNGSKSGDQKRKTPPTSLPDTSGTCFLISHISMSFSLLPSVVPEIYLNLQGMQFNA